MKKYRSGCLDPSISPPNNELNIRAVRKKHPRARLNAVYDSKGGFKAWRIVSGRMFMKNGRSESVVDVVLSGLHGDDEAAWLEAAERIA